MTRNCRSRSNPTTSWRTSSSSNRGSKADVPRPQTGTWAALQNKRRNRMFCMAWNVACQRFNGGGAGGSCAARVTFRGELNVDWWRKLRAYSLRKRQSRPNESGAVPPSSETEPAEKWEISHHKPQIPCVFALSARRNRPSVQVRTLSPALRTPSSRGAQFLGDTQTRMTMQASETNSPGGLTGRLTEVALGYQRMRDENPRHPEALVGICLVALASRQSEAAVKMATAAVAAAPGMGTAWVALGQALKAASRAEEADWAYREAIRLDGMNALARMGLGELMLASSRPEEALREFELALRRQPAMAPAHMGLGNALAMMGRNGEAMEHYDQTLALCPRLPAAPRGRVCRRVGVGANGKAEGSRAPLPAGARRASRLRRGLDELG